MRSAGTTFFGSSVACAKPPATAGGSALGSRDAVGSAFVGLATPLEEMSFSNVAKSSPFWPIMAIASPRAAVSPAPFNILSRVPPLRAVISIVALSVSTSASVSFASNASPSFFTQRAICPSSIVGESFGIKNFSAIFRNADASSASIYTRTRRPRSVYK